MKRQFTLGIILFLVPAVLLACGDNAAVNNQPTAEQNPVAETKVAFSSPTNTVAPLPGASTPVSTEAPPATIEQVTPSTSEIEFANETPTVVPTQVADKVDPTPFVVVPYSCVDIDTNWGNNWETVIAALEYLIANNQSCGEEPLSRKKYAAHFTYAVSLENEGKVDAAIAQYQAALLIDPQRTEALKKLLHLDALPEPTPVACQSTSPPLPDPVPAELPDISQFVTTQGNQLQLNGQLFKIKGINYYPRHAPWYRFVEEADLSEMIIELDVIKQAGFNTIRVFLRYEPLFVCQPEDAIPDEVAFAKIDKLFELARERDLKMIVTLNDLPDLMFRPLYTDWAHYDTQTIYIVRRYRNEPNILAWDLRNEGDLDYGIRPDDDPKFSQDEVMTWLAHISQLVRENDAHHLLTAGWWGDPKITGPYVDILSFHHWSEADQLQVRINDYRQCNDKPLLLQEVGYHSWAEAPHTQRDGAGQADILGRVVNVAEVEGVSGWIVWTAFDFIPKPGEPYNYEHFFGLWQVDLAPKPALQTLPLQ